MNVVSSFRTLYHNFIEQYVLLSTTNYKSSNLPDKSTDSEIIIIIRLDDKNSDTEGKIKVIPWLASYEISKPEVNKTVSNTQLSTETDAFMTAIKDCH
jgi:hypothetical protein